MAILIRFLFPQNSTLEVASWAVLVGILCIPELIFVAHMISEHWVSEVEDCNKYVSFK